MSQVPYEIVPPAGVAGWHRNIDRLWRYVRAIAPGGGMPSRRDFDPVDIPDLLPRIWMLDVALDPFALTYRLCGTMETASLERDPTGQSFMDVHADRIAREPHFLDRYRHMARTGEATWRRGRLVLGHNDRHKTVENLMVPMTDGGAAVAILLCYSLVFRADGSLY
ncbi:MAG: PAS domain-containing protein [Rhodospirillales bacterium]|nr:PAS domain-containing protein [Rhodospirillales bacterium]